MQLFVMLSVGSSDPQPFNLGIIDIFGWIILCCVCRELGVCLVLGII